MLIKQNPRLSHVATKSEEEEDGEGIIRAGDGGGDGDVEFAMWMLAVGRGTRSSGLWVSRGGVEGEGEIALQGGGREWRKGVVSGE